MKTLWRYSSVVSISLTVVLTLLSFKAVKGQWTWNVHQGPAGAQHIPQLDVEFLPIPLTFLMWVICVERDSPFCLRFSPFFCALSVFCLIIMQHVAYYDVRQSLLGLGIVFGLFVMVPFKDAIQRMVLQPRLTFVLIAGASAACNYYWLMNQLWLPMCYWTTLAVATIVQLIDFNVTVNLHPQNAATMILGSLHFTILVNKGCNGLEGLFLFHFMLSIMLLLDWQTFRGRSIGFLYIFGAVYMFVMNTLRITLFFSLGYWAYNPHSWAFMRMFRGAPVELFHTYAGWLFYLVAFWLFSVWMYHIPRIPGSRQVV